MKKKNNIADLIGKSRVSDAMPLLKIVAEEKRLNLNRVKDFNEARRLLEERYTIKKII